MNFFDRLSNGWRISMDSYKVLKANRQLIIFPVLSGISLLLLLGSYGVGLLAASNWNPDNLVEFNTTTSYLFLFLYYIINCFIIAYFNTALVHCSSLYFKGEEVSVRKGLDFSFSRIGVIFSWAVFAGTIGALLRIIQENVGWAGKIITGILGAVWGIATFFVIPILAYEKLGPIGAFKRSAQIMKNKWGESLGATFSFGLVQLAGIIIIAIPSVLIGMFIHPIAGIAIGGLALMLLFAIVSATQTIFVSAVYHNINGDPVEHFNQQYIDNLFEKK